MLGGASRSGMPAHGTKPPPPIPGLGRRRQISQMQFFFAIAIFFFIFLSFLSFCSPPGLWNKSVCAAALLTSNKAGKCPPPPPAHSTQPLGCHLEEKPSHVHKDVGGVGAGERVLVVGGVEVVHERAAIGGAGSAAAETAVWLGVRDRVGSGFTKGPFAVNSPQCTVYALRLTCTNHLDSESLMANPHQAGDKNLEFFPFKVLYCQGAHPHLPTG